jgi:hypothetical protein
VSAEQIAAGVHERPLSAQPVLVLSGKRVVLIQRESEADTESDR